MKGRLRFSTLCFYGLTLIILFASVVSFAGALSFFNKPFAGFLIYDTPYVGSMSIRDWPGRQAGLKFLERVVSIDDQPVWKGRDVVTYARERGPGARVIYVIKSKGQTREVTLPVTIFGFRDFFLTFVINLFGGLAIFCLGCIVYVLKPRVRTSWVFLLFCFFLGLYMITSFEILSTYRLVHIHYFALCFMGITLFHLGLIFPDRKQILIRFPALEYLGYPPAFIIAVGYQIYFFNFPEMLSAGAFAWMPDYKQIGTVLRIFSLICAVGMLACVFHALYRASAISAQQRARMILFGATVGFLPPAVIMTAFYFLKINFPWNFLVVFVVFFPAFIAYSIARHNLFEADAIIKRTVGYVVVTAVVVGAYALVSVSLNVVMGQYQLAQSRGFPLIFTLAILLVFNPLRNRVQAVVDKLFFRKEYDYQTTVQKISETMRSLLNPDQICGNIMKFALEPMFIDSGSVMILGKDKSEYECYVQSGEREDRGKAAEVRVKATLSDDEAVIDDEVKNEGAADAETDAAVGETSDLKLSADDPLLQRLSEHKKELTIYDVQEDPLFKADREGCEKTFERLGATLVIPLIYEDRLTGLISLGNKKSGKLYQREDINLLNTLAGQGALAVENARMVEEIVEKERLRAKILDTFGKYVTHEVRDQILEGSIPMDGEAKDVTLLFADLRDFTTLAESTTPKEVVKIINGYFSEMADAIGENKGLVLQFIGDEIEAVFGAPLPLEDHPTHAIRAALAMRQRLVVVNEKLEQQGYGPLRHGIGIHTGSVVAANIGSEDRLSYAMVGDTVNIASRIQGLNKEFGTDLLISATTVERLAENIEVEKLPAATVKGKREPVNIFKLK
jgi:class 3 adenylate cyclase